jgi:hypothetical protein
LRDYKKWLLTLNSLKDCVYISSSGEHNHKFRDSELEEFRNHPKWASVIREPDYGKPYDLYRSSYSPNYDDLAAHHINCREKTIFTINQSSSDTLLMLIDVDNKQGGGDVDKAAEYILKRHLGGYGIIQESTYGKGRHIYFLLSVEFITRSEIWSAFQGPKGSDLMTFSKLIKTDSFLQSLGVSFDQCVCYGLPTLWTGSKGNEKIVKRGNELRLPYVDSQRDLQNFQNLKALSFECLREFLSAKRTAAPAASTSPIHKTYLGVTTPLDPKNAHFETATAAPDSLLSSTSPIHKTYLGVTTPKAERWGTDLDGWNKRIACVSYNLIHGIDDLDLILADYHQHYHPTGMTEKDIRKRMRHFVWQLHAFQESFRKPKCSPPERHGFQKDQYLDLIGRIVPEASYRNPDGSKQRDKITPEKLSDFLSIKIQDAFFEKENRWFGSTSRNATIKNMKTLKEKGLVDWVVNNHTYKRLLEIAVELQLLKIEEKHDPPSTGQEGMKIVLRKGKARLIGPGAALPELRTEWLKLYHSKRSSSLVKVA